MEEDDSLWRPLKGTSVWLKRLFSVCLKEKKNQSSTRPSPPLPYVECWHLVLQPAARVDRSKVLRDMIAVSAGGGRSRHNAQRSTAVWAEMFSVFTFGLADLHRRCEDHLISVGNQRGVVLGCSVPNYPSSGWGPRYDFPGIKPVQDCD